MQKSICYVSLHLTYCVARARPETTHLVSSLTFDMASVDAEMSRGSTPRDDDEEEGQAMSQGSTPR